ncbi:CS1-pili formation C-terminal domain-containing protein [Bordetella genomosp. 9]|uniref:Probable outer membrane usher protein EcpC n=1 Tax=Bordetella genomosp. 9 TaxID=1416803 RepID=A0A1W6YWX2_9BORD|nr:CS1-pili formation C-terminal domain-containing protein [Bordetella genomosp. 9]ARP85103.1 pilus assembly protein PapC [Bordetella genomosp. 9]
MAAFASSSHAVVQPPAAALSVLQQAEQLPEDFREHFFEVPLGVRVERDGQYLGDALVTLSRTAEIQLIEFTDFEGSTLAPEERQRWATYLAEPRRLGQCEGKCEAGLMALHYSLENSVLSIATNAAERDQTTAKYYALPEAGSRGVILHNNLNVTGGQRQSLAGRYSVDLVGSVGNWTAVGSLLAAQSADTYSTRQYSAPRAYLQREMEGHFVRGGFFVPDMQGAVRPPRTPGGLPATTFGVMAGTSDALEIASEKPSLYPVYVTANRQGTVEVYRNGVMMHSQPVEPGLQALDTRRLPGGIYEVEVRVVEDGNVTSTRTELIYKPNNWRNLEKRWRYAVFAGQQRSLLDSGDRSVENDMAMGGVINYLAHPRVIVGASAQQIGSNRSIGGSLDWQVSNMANIYANLYHSTQHGMGTDVQAMFRYNGGTVTLNHNRTWQYADPLAQRRAGNVKNSGVSVHHRIGSASALTGRVSHSSGVTSGLGLDLGLSHRHTLFGTELNWRVSAFDRPAGLLNGRRNRGVDVTLNFMLGKEGRRYHASVGTRSASNGGRDQYFTAGVQQDLNGDIIKRVGASATGDRYGIGVTGNALIQHRLAHGDVFASRSSIGGTLSGGVNLYSSMAVGGGAVAASGSSEMLGRDTGMIVDVESDLPEVPLRAFDSHGGSATLKPGRNFVPVTAYRPGKLQFDFDGGDAPAAAVQPALGSYHLNKGGVGYQKVRVMKTVTVMGRVVDEEGEPLKGAHVVNHAGRAVTEADGFFTLEMSERTPTVTIRHRDVAQCELSLDGPNIERDADTLMVGDLQCGAQQVVRQDEKLQPRG